MILVICCLVLNERFFFCSQYGVHQQKRITVTSYPSINLTDIGNLSSKRRVCCSGKILTAHERRGVKRLKSGRWGMVLIKLC